MWEPKSTGGREALGALAARDDVAGGVDPRFQAGRFHQAHSIAASGDVGIGIGDAADAIGKSAAGWTAEHAERFQVLAQTGGVDPRGGSAREAG